ncbi:MAG TPA: efflux RND transporter periplasmic adaptor subunit [Acidobacteriaceae bacterium]|nr:efflux RND transporter periplasmic adaptor subunit [Acidobacteriaceae bacterium]
MGLVRMVDKDLKGIFVGVLAGLTIMAAAGCSGGSAPRSAAMVAGASSPAPAARQHEKVQPAAQQQAYLIVTGPVIVEQQLNVVALRNGVLTTLNADVDTTVRSGQLLAQLDDRQLAADRSAAEFKVQSLAADLKNWESEVDVRQTDLKRAEEMRTDGINTQETLDHTRYDLSATKFEVQRQRGEMQSAQAAVNSLDLELEKTKIAAPFDGVVSQRYVRQGEYVHVGDRLFQVTGNSPLEIRFTLSARDGAALQRGDEVSVSPTPDFRVAATASVTHISPVVDPGSGTMEVTAVLRRKLPGLLPGIVASVRVPRKP